MSSSRGPVSLQMLLNDGRSVHRHFDHVRSASSSLVNPGKPASVSEQENSWADTRTTRMEEAIPNVQIQHL